MQATCRDGRRLAAAVLGAALAGATPASAQEPGTGVDWQEMPRMELEQTYAGPQRDTIIQRWRDPIDGNICYIYLPIIVQHSAPTDSGYVQYGAGDIGSISCAPASPE